MKYVPKEISENDNVSSDDPLKVFIKAGVGIVAIFVAAFLSLTGITEFAITFMPQQVNHSLGGIYRQRIATPKDLAPARESIQAILDQLVAGTDLAALEFRVEIMPADFKNAMAMPGGLIVITTALLEEIDEESDLVFILGHEIGHYQHSDHLRGLSRAAILMGLLGVAEVSGARGVNQLVGGSLNFFELNYSRGQETRADEMGLELTQRYYGRVPEAARIFNHFRRDNEEIMTARGFMSTHPISSDRIEHFRSTVHRNGYLTGGIADFKPYDFESPQKAGADVFGR